MHKESDLAQKSRIRRIVIICSDCGYFTRFVYLSDTK